MLLYKKYKKDKVGICNICRKHGQLSYDHIPPRGGIEIKPVEIYKVFQMLSTKKEGYKYDISQNGFKIRTICDSCNSLIGTKYDVVLNEFALGIGRFLKSNLHFEDLMHYETQPTAVAKAILAHIVSAKIEIDGAGFDDEIVSFIFDDNAAIPEGIHIFYWIYPYNQTTIMLDVQMPAVRGKYDESGFFSILKYFPIGYLLANLKKYEGLDELTKYRELKPNQTVKLPIRLNNIMEIDWPERVDAGNFLLMGQAGSESVQAKPRKKKK